MFRFSSKSAFCVCLLISFHDCVGNEYIYIFVDLEQNFLVEDGRGGMVTTFLRLAAQSVDKGCVGEHAVLVLGVAQLGHQLLDVLLGDLVAQVGEDVLQLGQHHRAVVVLVVQLEQLDVVVVVAGGLGGVLGLLHLGDDLVELAELLALLVGLAELDAHLDSKE